VSTVALSGRFDCALVYATHVHAGQVRKGAEIPYVAHLEVVAESVLLVSAADKLHNARAILLDYGTVGEEIWDRFKVSRDETLWYYRRVSEILTKRLPGPLTRELADTVARLDELAAGPGVQ